MAALGGEAVTFDAPAKVNLKLSSPVGVPTGTFDLTVIFTAFGDRLTVVRPPERTDRRDRALTLLAGEPDNICLRAKTSAIGGAVGPLAVTVEKNIPVGAGLAAGRYAAAMSALDRCDAPDRSGRAPLSPSISVPRPCRSALPAWQAV